MTESSPMDNFSTLPLSSEYCKGLAISNVETFNFLSSYYQEYYGKGFIDLSFLVIQQNMAVAAVICFKVENQLCRPSDGIKIYFFSVENQKKLSTYIVSHIEKQAKINHCNEIIIKDEFSNGALSYLGESLFNQKYFSRLTFEMLIDYEKFNEGSYRANIRKSYKSFINWGKKNLDTIVINNASLSLESFIAFKEFHLKIAGKKTRSDKSWDIQYNMVEKGYGELLLAYYQGSLVAGSLFTDEGDVSTYCTGVYERELFEFGLSHYLIYQGICRSRMRGTSQFSLGYFDTDISDPKWYKIQFFKKGFCEKLTPTILWSKNINV